MPEIFGFYNLNSDIDTRDTLIFGKYVPGYNCKNYNNMSAKTLQKLVDEGFADPRDKQNNAPTLGEFLEFMKTHPDYKAHGYAIENTRKDYRVTVEGLEKNGHEDDPDTISEFTDLFKYADTFSVNGDGMYCWYD